MYSRSDRGGMFYLFNKQTEELTSLGTTDRNEAQKLLDVENRAREASSLNLQLGAVYLRNADPNMAKRVWQHAMDDLSSHGKEAAIIYC